MRHAQRRAERELAAADPLLAHADRAASYYAFRVELLDAAGQVRLSDGPLPPLGGYWPTHLWPPGIVIIDYRDVFLPGDLPPGTYTVRVSVVPAAHPDQPLLLADGSSAITLSTPLTVVPWQK